MLSSKKKVYRAWLLNAKRHNECVWLEITELNPNKTSPRLNAVSTRIGFSSRITSAMFTTGIQATPEFRPWKRFSVDGQKRRGLETMAQMRARHIHFLTGSYQSWGIRQSTSCLYRHARAQCTMIMWYAFSGVLVWTEIISDAQLKCSTGWRSFFCLRGLLHVNTAAHKINST